MACSHVNNYEARYASPGEGEGKGWACQVQNDLDIELVHLFEAGKPFAVKNGRLDSPRVKASAVLAHGRCKAY